MLLPVGVEEIRVYVVSARCAPQRVFDLYVLLAQVDSGEFSRPVMGEFSS